MRGEQRAQKIAEGDVDRWTVIKRPGADGEELLRGAGRLHGEAVGQRRRQVGFLDAAAAGAEDAEQVEGPATIDGEKSVECGGDQDRAALMRLRLGRDLLGAFRRYPRRQRAAQAALPASRLTKLRRQRDQRILRVELRLNDWRRL